MDLFSVPFSIMTSNRVDSVSGYLLYITLLREGAIICLFPPDSSVCRQEWHTDSRVATVAVRIKRDSK